MHTVESKDDLILRIKKIRGQLNAAERALEEESNCSRVLHSLITCKGAIGSLISEILEGHIHEHILDPKSKPTRDQIKAARELVDMIKTYLV